MMVTDFRRACRNLIRSPRFTLVAASSIAIGIAASTAIFSFVHSVLLAPLPFPASDRLIVIQERVSNNPVGANPVRMSDWLAAPSLAGITGVYGESYTVQVADLPERVPGLRTFGDFLATFNVQPARGRAFTESERRGLGAPVALITDTAWRKRFAGEPAAVGRSIRLNGKPCEIIGVLPPGASFEDAEIIAPEPDPSYSRKARFMLQIARLCPGAALDTAARELDTVAARLRQQYPATDADMTLAVSTLRDHLAGEARMPLLVLMAAVGVVLAIAAANVANLCLSRIAGRRQELAVREALGARRWDLVRMLTLESGVIVVAGGILGFIAAVWTVDALVRLAPADLPRLAEVRLDWRAALFAAGVTVIAALIAALLPAWRQTAGMPSAALKDGMRSSTRTHGFRQFLVAAQVALSLALVIGGALLFRSLWNLEHRPLGFTAERVLSFRLSLPWQTEQQKLDGTYTQVLDRLQALPGVEGAALTDRLPLDGDTQSSDVEIAGRDPRSLPPGARISQRAISPAFHSVMKVPLLAGRLLTPADSASMRALINQSAARAYFPDSNPIGRTIGSNKKQYEIVGVVADLPNRITEKVSVPAMYVPFQRTYWPLAHFVVKTRDNPIALAAEVRRQVASIDPSLAVELTQSVESFVDSRNQIPRLEAWLVGVFAAAALLLAGVGIFGLVAGTVADRRVEIGIRMALGATPSTVVRETVSRLARQIAAGAVAGLLLAAAFGRVIQASLYEVTPRDYTAWVGGAALLAAVAVAAAWWPARRASQLDPADVLRRD